MDTVETERIKVRLAETPEEILAAQKLRYKVFFEEDGAKSSVRAGESAIDTHGKKIDTDEFDAHADILIAIDKAAGPDPDAYVVGTYRLMRRKGAAAAGKWYSQAEFDVEKFDSVEGEILELGRSCVAKEYRSAKVMKMMWNALAAYMFDHGIVLMFGCGTFIGTDPGKFAHALSYLYYWHREKGALATRARGGCAHRMDLLPKDRVDAKLAMRQIPALIKGYLRVGAKVGGQCWIDYGFNGVDVCIIFKTKNLRPDYKRHYERMKCKR